MYWKDTGYLLYKTNYDENSILIETFTLGHGKCTGIVYGGTSRKQKGNFQIGNKLLLNWKSKNENKMGYFNIELLKPIAPYHFDDKKKSISLLSATTILKLLLPERQVNSKIYNSFEALLETLNAENWIKYYIYWELSLIKELGFDINIENYKNINTSENIEINNRHYVVPKILFNDKKEILTNKYIKEALIFNKSIIMENFILPNRLKFPLSRNILEKYYN